MAMFIVKPWYRKKDDAIYGAEWAGTSDPSWVRTDAAVGFADPNPYYSGMSTTPSSPFDNIMPWGGMRRVTDASAGELVEIPKFYYKWTRDGVKMKLQISMSQFDGSHVSPAHADRGDGVGERDYVYVGRYHCATSTYKSTSGVYPRRNQSRDTFRTNIHNLGSNVWQWDYATLWTIRMLYLVEFANWNSQEMIGYGGGSGSTYGNMGYTDSMPYHTGTTQSNRTTYGLGTQYRYIEGLWDNVYDWIDGITFNTTSVYCFKNPSNFSSDYTSTGSTLVGVRSSSYSGCISAWTDPSSVTGFEYALYCSAINGADYSTYCSDSCSYNASYVDIYVGGNYSHGQYYGMFYMSLTTGASSNVGSRLMVLPPSRLSA